MKICFLTKDEYYQEKLSSHFSIITNLSDIYSYDVIILISYPYLISKSLLKKKVFLNVHNSLLPKYRGLHAFTWAIINGENEVGYTLHKVDEGVDSGAIISQLKIPIRPNDDINTVFAKASKALLPWVTQEALAITDEKIKNARAQAEENATYVCKRKLEDGGVNWFDSSKNIYNFVRALAPPYTPGAYTFLNTKKIFIHEANIISSYDYIERPGKILFTRNGGFSVKTGDGSIYVEKYEVGEQPVTGTAFLRPGCTLSS